ncbi:DUF982 domain-containing protein [Bosea sp. LjRoot90]|uniref:DUF982 domain-containing protein n=1 Tax=Bosea sp. LjRoot90 TaxID=3342342 RepID=UPI003F4F4D63
MPRHWFSPPVAIETSRPGQFLAVTSVEQAARQLLQWPAHGPEWRGAVSACAEALSGKKPASDARSAFVEAAKAADRLISIS